MAFNRRLRRELGDEDREPFFYHVVPLTKLDSIKSAGLTVPGAHRMGNSWSPTNEVTDRLFLFTGERVAIGWISTCTAGVLLRFRREVIADTPRFEDHMLHQNEESFGRRPVVLFSFCVNATFPTLSIEGCRYVKRESGHDAWSAYEWMPLDQVKDRTRALVKGQLVDQVDAGLPSQKWEERRRWRR